MRRAPIVLVAVLVAMVLTAAMARLRARPPRRRIDARDARAQASRATALSAAATGLGAGPPPDAGAPREPTTLHGDARRTHRAAGRAPRSIPAVAWARDVGGPVEAQVTTSADGQTLYVATLGGALAALARGDGRELWRAALGDRAYSTPCVGGDGTIYVGSDGGKLSAVSPQGKIEWTFDTDGDADTGAAIAGDGTVIFAAGRMVYGVTPRGRLKWRFAARRKVFTAPALGGSGRIFFGSQDHRAYALDPDGRLAWSVDLGHDVDGAPAVGDDGAVFFGTDGGEVVRLDPADGRVAWRAAVGGYVRGPLSVARDGDVLAGVYGPAPRAVRLDSSSGSVRGAFPIQGTGALEFGVHGGALEDDSGTLVFGAQDDDVYAVDASGRLLWRFETGGDVDAPVTLLDDGVVVVASDDGTVRALRSEY